MNPRASKKTIQIPILILAAFLFAMPAFAYTPGAKYAMLKLPKQEEAKPQDPGYVEGELLVTFHDNVNPEALIPGLKVEAARCAFYKSGVVAAERAALRKQKALKPGLRKSGKEYTGAQPEPTEEELFIRAKGAMSKEERRLFQTYLVTLKRGESAKDAAIRLAKNPYIKRVEPNYIVSAQWVPDDPSYASQWALPNINAPAAWDITRGDSNAVIAFIDSGIDYNHEDLAANMWRNPEEIAGNGIDDDANGFIDDIYGYDFRNNDADPLDDFGHGTHCSGIAAAVTDNGIGIAGACPNAKLMAVKFMNSSGFGTVAGAANGIYYAARNGAKVISNSWNGIGTSTVVQAAVDFAYTGGCFLVASAGNDNMNVDGYLPANCLNMFVVASIDSANAKASNSNFGSKVDVAAPGVSILSTVPGNLYANMSGTSMACPYVAGEAALLLSFDPSYTPLQVANAIRAGTTPDITSSSYVGMGRINLFNALGVVPPSEALARISGPVYNTSQNTPVPVSGTATGTCYSLMATQTGPYALDYAQFAEGLQVPAGALGSFYPASGGWYFVKLAVTDPGGYQLSNVTRVLVNRPAPVISGLDPVSGMRGSSLVINGTAFGPDTAQVNFGDIPASINYWSDTSITCVVPELDPGTYPVTVIVGGVTSNPVDFTVTAPPGPFITFLDPDHGYIGCDIVINGGNFGAGQGDKVVKFDLETAVVNSWSDTAISVKVPAVHYTVVPVYLAVGGENSNLVDFTVTAPLPVISGITPSSGTKGSQVTISGTSLKASVGVSSVSFADIGSEIVGDVTDGSINCIVPDLAPGTYLVMVETNGGTSNAVDFEVTASAPVITSIDPLAGAAGAVLSINGSGFGNTQGSATVSFADIGVAVTSWSDTLIHCIVPDISRTVYPVTVTTAGGSSNAVDFEVTFPAPVILGFSSNPGFPGSLLAIHCDNLIPGGSIQVRFADVGAQVLSSDDTTIFCIVPQLAGGIYPVTVTTAGGTSNAMDFRVLAPAPAIVSRFPIFGAEDSDVTLTGSNFGNSGTVLFADVSAVINSWSDTSVSVKVPDLGGNGGTQPVRVSNVNGTSNSVDFYVLTMPSIASLSPTGGYAGRNLLVEISGANFANPGFLPEVRFGDILARNIVSLSDNLIGCMVTLSPGTYQVTVTNRVGTSNAASFNVINPPLPPPVAVWLSDPVACSGQEVTIYGRNFGASQGQGWAEILGIEQHAPSVTYWSDSRIRFIVPAIGASYVNTSIKVNDDYGRSSNLLPFRINRYPVPAVASVAPAQGPSGSAVTISGTGFQATQGTVSFADINAAVTAWSDTSIGCMVPGLASGEYPVTVTTAGGTSNPVNFAVAAPAPRIDSLDPAATGPGQSVKISGVGFGLKAPVIGGVDIFNPAGALNHRYPEITYWSDTVIRFTVPGGFRRLGAYKLVVNNVYKVKSNAVDFVVEGGLPKRR